MIYEHSRFIKKHKVLGLFTEECIEALHRAENESTNLTSAIRFVLFCLPLVSALPSFLKDGLLQE